jgi:hypothetical protein
VWVCCKRAKQGVYRRIKQNIARNGAFNKIADLARQAFIWLTSIPHSSEQNRSLQSRMYCCCVRTILVLRYLLFIQDWCFN